MPDRVGDWGCTYTGRQYWPEDPRPYDICIEDIAHALSLQCRYGGHCRTFFSVAQHAVLVSEHCAPQDALWGLLHDASEAYLIDLPRPVKRSRGMEGYFHLEAAMMAAVCLRFGLPLDMPRSVAVADEVLLATEARDLMPPASVARWTLLQPPLANLQITPLAPLDAERLFLQRYTQLAQPVALAEVANA